jgi:hypothetical protein
MNYTTLTFEEAAKRFSDHAFSLFDYYKHHKNETVKVIEDDTVLNDLSLDVLPNDQTIAYIFMGNLTVLGSIWNENTDGAMSLMVLKNVKAKNMAVGGQEICIKGNLEVEELLCGSYNHGSMTVKGNVKAQYILDDDYAFTFEGTVKGIIFNDVHHGYYKVNNWKDSLDNFMSRKTAHIDYFDMLNPSVYNAYHDSFDFSALIKCLNKGDKLFINNKEKLNQLAFNNCFLIELFDALQLDKDVNEFGFGLQYLDLSFNFHKNAPNYYLEIKLRNESFEYELKDTVFTTHLLTHNSLPKKLDANNDVKSYYRAIRILQDTAQHISTFVLKRNSLLITTQNIIPNLFPIHYPVIYNELKMLYNNPMAFYENNRPFFDGLKIDYLDWSFQKRAILNILKELNIVLVINGKEYISYALNDITQWFKQHDFDIDTDWKARGLYLKRRLEYFSKDVLIVNTICEEKNIPLSILDFSLWLNDRFIVFIPVNNQHKNDLIIWLNELDIK